MPKKTTEEPSKMTRLTIAAPKKKLDSASSLLLLLLLLRLVAPLMLLPSIP